MTIASTRSLNTTCSRAKVKVMTIDLLSLLNAHALLAFTERCVWSGDHVTVL